MESNNSNQFINNTTAIYENIVNLNEKEKESALELLFEDAEKNLGKGIYEIINDPNELNFLMDIIDNSNEYSDKYKTFLTSLIYDTENFKKYVNKFYETKYSKISDNEKKDAIKKLIEYIENAIGLSIEMLNNEDTDKNRVSEFILEMLPKLYDCKRNQKKYLRDSIISGNFFKIAEDLKIEELDEGGILEVSVIKDDKKDNKK